MRELIVGFDALLLLAGGEGAGLDLSAAAALADLAGADSVRAGVDRDASSDEVRLLQIRRATGGFELRMAPEPALIKTALEVRPDRVVLTSEPRPAGSRPQPFDWQTSTLPLAPALSQLRDAGIPAMVLTPPDLEAVKAAHAAEAAGVELFTGHLVDLPLAERQSALQALNDAARLAAKLRMSLSVGGGLDLRSASEVLGAVPMAERVAVGRAFVSRAALLGIERAVRDLRERIG